VDSPDIIFHYFPELSDGQRTKILQLGDLYQDWNSKINLISRKDIDNLYTNHILHSLSIAKIIDFKAGTRILDIGTGGGLPGIPLAIAFPQVRFHLIDSTQKKITAVNDIVDQLELIRVQTEWNRVEDLKGTYDFILGRAVTSISQFLDWSRARIDGKSRNKLNNGVLYLKGGDLKTELQTVRQESKVYSLSDYFVESYYLEKKIVHLAV